MLHFLRCFLGFFLYPAPLLHVTCRGVEFYLLFSHIFQTEFVQYNPNYTRAAKRPASIIEII